MVRRGILTAVRRRIGELPNAALRDMDCGEQRIGSMCVWRRFSGARRGAAMRRLFRDIGTGRHSPSGLQ